MQINSIAEIIEYCEQKGCQIADLAYEYEQTQRKVTREAITEQMEFNLQAMEKSVAKGLAGVQSHSGFTGGDALKLAQYREQKRGLMGDVALAAINYAVAVNEVNAAMGIICATPTAGSAGVVPAVLLAVREQLKLSRQDQINFLMTAAICGMVIGNKASISGAAGGCQAEVGSASAMAAAALVEACGGTPSQSGHALAIALMNTLGLACDPVAGLVEIPCIKRNAMGATNALTGAEMALADVRSRIPVDEVIEAMGRIGQMMPIALRETALGGLAATKTGKMLAERLQKQRAKLNADFPVSSLATDITNLQENIK